MRTHGWGGDPPATDAEAVARIVAAAVDCLERGGGEADLASVAAHIGVTRQTVYRYFPTSRSLFEAVAGKRAEALVDRMAAHLTPALEPADAVVEIMMFGLREFPADPLLRIIATPERGYPLIATSDAPGITLVVLDRLPIDLEHLDAAQRAMLAEHMVRLLQALLLDGATETRDDTELRCFLRSCLYSSVHPETMRG